MKVLDVCNVIEKVAPLQLQESYDNAGLQIGDPEMEVTGIVTTLDVTEESVAYAIRQNANLIVSHHPLLFRGTKQINPKKDYISRVIIEAIRHDIAIYSAHTNLDNAPMGVNWKIGELLGLTEVRPLARLSGCQLSGLTEEFSQRCGSGIIGQLKNPMPAKTVVERIKSIFSMDAVAANAEVFDLGQEVSTIALCGGAGDDFIDDAISQGAQIYLTGEVSYHLFFGHPEILIVQGGHYETEQYTSKLLEDIILQQYPQVKINIFSKSSPVKIL